MRQASVWRVWNGDHCERVISRNYKLTEEGERLLLNTDVNDNVELVTAKVLYQTSEAVKVYIPAKDTEIWVPLQYIEDRSGMHSGQEVEIELQPAWLN